MTEPNLVLELLKRIQADQSAIRTSIESIDLQLAALRDHQSGHYLDQLALRQDLTLVQQRLERIERRLELNP